MNITKKTITNLIKLMKALKTPTILIYNNMAIDCNNLVSLNYACMSDLYSEIKSVYTLEQLSFLDSILDKITICTTDMFGNILLNNEVVVNNVIVQLDPMYDNLCYQVYCLTGTIPDRYYPDMRMNEIFEEALISPQNILFKIDEMHHISLFKGLLPLNKADKVSIEIYDSFCNDFICKYSIDKKSFILNTCYRHIYLYK